MLDDYVVKIAKQIYALNFRKIKNKNTIVLMDNKFDVSPQYVIFIDNGFYVYKLLQFKNITVCKLTQDQFLNIIDACQFQDKNILQDFSKDNYYFKTIEQCYDYFVKNVGMQLNQFQQLFDSNYSDYDQFVYKGINVKVSSEFNKKNYVKLVIDQVKNKINYSLFDNLLIVFNDITQRDSNNVQGNRVGNQYGFDNVINIGSFNMVYNLFHQLGHIYQQKYLNLNEIDDIYDYVLNHQDINVLNDYFLIYDQCVPQLFALYYTNSLQLEYRKFVQEKILK